MGTVKLMRLRRPCFMKRDTGALKRRALDPDRSTLDRLSDGATVMGTIGDDTIHPRPNVFPVS